MNQATPETALTPSEHAVLDAIDATGQGDGRLHDVQAVARRVGCTAETVNAAVRSLHGKGYLPPLGISDDTRQWAQRTYAEFLATLREQQQRGAVTWRRLGADPHMVGRICRGTPLRGPTAERLGRMAGLPADRIAEASKAARFLYRSEGSGSHQKAKAATPARKQVLCAVCKTPLVWHGPRDRRTPVCVACVRRRTKARIVAKGRAVFTERGGKLCDALLDRWGSLTKLRSATGIGTSTLHRFFFDPEFHPREASLRRLAEAAQVSYETLYSKYGPTQEDKMRRPPRICQTCGRPLRRNHDGWMCSTLARAARTIREDLDRLIVTLAAAAVGLEPDRIATLVDAPLVTVNAWLRDPPRVKTVAEIRARKMGNGLLPAMASVLGIDVETLRVYRSGRARRPGHRRLKYPDPPAQTLEALGITKDEFLQLGRFKRTATEFYRDHMTALRRKSWHLVRGRPDTVRQGRPVSDCAVVREIVVKRHEEASDDEVFAILEDRQVAWVALKKQIPEFLIQHARRCRPCRPGVAYDLHQSGETIRDVARRLGVSRGTAERLIACGHDRIHQWAHRLRTREPQWDNAPSGRPV